jgi:hypothetical protein
MYIYTYSPDISCVFFLYYTCSADISWDSNGIYVTYITMEFWMESQLKSQLATLEYRRVPGKSHRDSADFITVRKCKQTKKPQKCKHAQVCSHTYMIIYAHGVDYIIIYSIHSMHTCVYIMHIKILYKSSAYIWMQLVHHPEPSPRLSAARWHIQRSWNLQKPRASLRTREGIPRGVLRTPNRPAAQRQRTTKNVAKLVVLDFGRWF